MRKKYIYRDINFWKSNKKLAYLNLFTHFESNVNKELIKGERWWMVDDETSKGNAKSSVISTVWFKFDWDGF